MAAFRREGLAVATHEDLEGAVGGFDLFLQERFVLRALLDPITPVAVLLVIVELVVDDLADQIGGFRRGQLLRSEVGMD